MTSFMEPTLETNQFGLITPINRDVLFRFIFSPQSGIAGELANLSLGEPSVDQIAYENQFRRANWEAGQIDYLGNKRDFSTSEST